MLQKTYSAKVVLPPTDLDGLVDLARTLGGIAVLGVCEDGIPLVVDVRDASPTLLASPDIARCQDVINDAQRWLLSLSMPHEVLVVRASERAPYGAAAGNLKRVSVYDRAFERALFEIADAVDSRAHGRGGSQAIALLIDDLQSASGIDREARWALEYILRNGRSNKVWVMAGILLDNLGLAGNLASMFHWVFIDESGWFSGPHRFRRIENSAI